jgi:protease-4
MRNLIASPTKSNRNLYLLLGGLGLFFVLSLSLGFWAFHKILGQPGGSIISSDDEITLLEIDGPIYDSDDMVRRIKRFRKSSHKVLLLRLNSPGGAVAPSQEIYTELRRARDEDKKIIVASVSSMAASGAYYIASACNQIVANPGSLTGSIGVIAKFPDASKLLQKFGVRFETIKSGEFKDTGNFDRPMTPAERRYMQSTIDDVYDQFLGDVAEGRFNAFQKTLSKRLGEKPEKVTMKEVKEHIRQWADGRVFTGRMALREGFVDKLGNYYDAVKVAADLGGVKGDPQIHLDRPVRWNDLVESCWPGSTAFIRQFTSFQLEYRAF